MTKNRRLIVTSFLSGRLPAIASLAVLALVVCLSTATHAETLRKRYAFSYDRTIRQASSQMAASEARKLLLRDFLAAKFAPEIINRLANDIDMALDPSDAFLTDFKVVSEKLNTNETQVTLTVEGDFDFAEMVSALVQNKVLSFGKQPPKVMVLPSPRFQDPSAAKALRALIYDKIKQAGLQPIAFESAAAPVNFPIKDKISLTGIERQALVRSAVKYGADYLIYIDAEVETKPFSQGGYIADANFIHTILRPNGTVILGESIVSERGSGSSQMLAFDRALDSVAPVIAKLAIGQLYQSIYSDSDVIYDTPQLKEEKTVGISFASAAVVQAVVERLQKTGAAARLANGMSNVTAQVKIETTMDDIELFQWFNQQTFSINGMSFTTPVVAYLENVIEVEAVADQARPQRQALIEPPPRRARRGSSASTRIQQGPNSEVARVVLKMRPPKFN
jgi:hypothetical protein